MCLLDNKSLLSFFLFCGTTLLVRIARDTVIVRHVGMKYIRGFLGKITE